MSAPLKAPFPWFGGKSRVAHLVWEAFGDCPNYVEPFAGSLAVLLGRPTPPRVETVNDADCYLANFWRAVSHAPEDVAAHADWPVNEADLHARHRWLLEQGDFRERMRREPDFFDVRIAGWWVWGLSQWIGSGWCVEQDTGQGRREGARPNLTFSQGIHRQPEKKRPLLGHAGRGVHRGSLKDTWQQKPDLSGSRGATGRGVHAVGARGALEHWFLALQERLRFVRVCCGDWKRIVTPSATTQVGLTAVFLDPPYLHEVGRDPDLYAQESAEVANEVRDWALAHGDDPALRIALCGYEGEHQMPASWRCEAWEAQGGYAAAKGNKENARRERIWFSPHCLKPDRLKQASLLEGLEAAR